MLTVATLLWDPNAHSMPFSRCYDESWVEKLYRGFARNLTRPFRFVCFTDRPRSFVVPAIAQEPLLSGEPTYGTCIEPYRLGVPMILAGLDTIVTGNVDDLAAYCEAAPLIALPRDPFMPSRACNGVALVPGEQGHVYEDWRGENDMEWMRVQPHAFIDDLFPGEVVSYKGTARQSGLGGARIVYFHGAEKPHELAGVDWVREHWA